MDNDKYLLIFLGNDGEFSYTYGEFDCVEYAFRTPRLFGLDWNFDGDTFISRETIFGEAGVTGTWTVGRKSYTHPTLWSNNVR